MGQANLVAYALNNLDKADWANSADPDQSAPLSSTLFVILFQYFLPFSLGSPMRYLKIFGQICWLSQCTTKPTIRVVRPAKIQISLRIFTDCKGLQQPPGYPRSYKREPLSYWMNVQADLSLRWSHRSYCRFCHAQAQFIVEIYNATIYFICRIYPKYWDSLHPNYTCPKIWKKKT